MEKTNTIRHKSLNGNKDPLSNGSKISVCIILPTYNESPNIKKLLDSIFLYESKQQFKKFKYTLSVLVVDDSSPDGTADIVRKYQEKNQKVHFLVRNSKDGLGMAYIAGMTHAMDMIKPNVIFEMDADLSHNPRYIFQMLKEIKNGADFVIGSRYVKGGKIPEFWGVHRKVISKTANTFTRVMLNLKNIHDCTSGFRAIRTSLLEKIDLSSLHVRGYAFQISLLDAVLQNNCVVREIPISFADRTQGKSKMGLKDITELGMVVLRLAAQKMLFRASGIPAYRDDMTLAKKTSER